MRPLPISSRPRTHFWQRASGARGYRSFDQKLDFVVDQFELDDVDNTGNSNELDPIKFRGSRPGNAGSSGQDSVSRTRYVVKVLASMHRIQLRHIALTVRQSTTTTRTTSYVTSEIRTTTTKTDFCPLSENCSSPTESTTRTNFCALSGRCSRPPPQTDAPLSQRALPRRRRQIWESCFQRLSKPLRLAPRRRHPLKANHSLHLARTTEHPHKKTEPQLLQTTATGTLKTTITIAPAVFTQAAPPEAKTVLRGLRILTTTATARRVLGTKSRRTRL